MRQETIRLFQFEELNEEAKERAIEKNQEINIEFDWWDFMYEGFREELKDLSIDVKNFFWDVGYVNSFYMGGVGICDNLKFLMGADCSKELNLLALNKTHVDIYDIGIKDNYGRNEVYVELDYDVDELTEEENKGIEGIRESIEGKLQLFIEGLNDKFLKSLREEYDYRLSDEAIGETLEINEYEFLEDGDRY